MTSLPDTLVQQLDSGSEPARLIAIHELKRHRQDAIPMLVRALGDASLTVRKQAIWALEEIRHLDALPGLQAALDDADLQVRALSRQQSRIVDLRYATLSS